MTSTIKFSEFQNIDLNISTNLLVGASSSSGGVNIKSSAILTWTTATRPATPAPGLLGFNSTLPDYEWWDAVALGWVPLGSGAFGSVTEVDTGTGLTGGPITNSGTISFAAIASHNLWANLTGGSAVPTSTTLSALMDASFGSAQGDILYRNSSVWTALTPGTNGYVLTTGGASANPQWTAVGASGAVVDIDGDSGTATPSAGTITISGGATGLLTSASGSTVDLVGILGSVYGGTGLNAPTAHGIMVSEGASPVNPIVLSTGQILIGSTGADPVAAAINSGTGILVGNGAGSITVSLADIASHDILSNITSGSAAPVANTLSDTIDAAIGSVQGDILYRDSSAWTVLAPGTSGYVLTSGGASANPSWTAVSASGAITTINGDSGSITPSGGAVTINGGSTGLTTSGSVSTLSLTGLLNSTYGGTGITIPTAHGVMIAEGASPMVPIVLGAGQILIGTTSSDPTAAAINSGTGILVGNGSGSITVSLAAIASHDILSNITGGSAAPIANTLSDTIDAAIGSTQGDILYRDSSAWNVLAPGTSGYVLTTAGVAANPSWQAAAGSTTSVITDDTSTNATVYPVWVTANSGSLPLKVTSTKLNFNPSTGNIVANNYIGSIAQIAAGGTTTLTNASSRVTQYSGAGSSTLIFPDATTLSNGFTIYVDNNGSGTITVKLNDTTTTLFTIPGGNFTQIILVSNATSNGTWNFHWLLQSSAGAGTLVMGNGSNAGYKLTTATYPVTATGTGTILRADGTNWVASTSTFSDTYAINTIPFASAANTITALAPALSSVLLSTATSTGVPVWSGAMTNGQLIIGSTGATPAVASLSAGTGISITPGAGSISIATTGAVVTPAALTKTDDTNVTLTLGGSPNTALVNAASLTLGWTGQLGLTRGGTAASLTASNGGIVYSTASALAILSGTATAGQLLQSGASTTPSWSTSTYPATNAINTLLYASSANVMAALATANSSVLVTSAGGVPSLSTTLPSGLTIPGFANAPTNTNITSMTGLAGALQQPTAIQDTTSQNLLSFTYAGAGTVTDYLTISNGATNGASIRLTSSNTNGTFVVLAKGSGGVFIGSAGTSTLPVVISTGSNTFSFSMSLSAARTLTFPDADRDLTQIPASTATANQILLSASSARPVWSTSTYPATNAINTLLYASSANVMAALATANSAVLITSSGGIPSLSTTLPAGITVPQPIIQGVTDASSAGAGVVGEVISSQVLQSSPLSYSNGVTKNLTSITLTAGDWNIWGNIGFGGSTVTQLWGGISTTTGAFPDSSLVTFINPASANNCYAPVVMRAVTISGSTTYYLVGQVTGTGTLVGAGILTARRIR